MKNEAEKISKFPEMLSKMRRERGVSQKKAATDLGISQALLSHYEKGIRECGLDFVIKCSQYYGVTTDYLLGISEEDDEKNKELIIKGDFYMPKELSAPLKDLLKHMLEPNEDNRFDFGKIGNHEWFKGCPVMTGGLNIFDLIYPVDDRVIKAVNYFGIDKDKVSDEL